MLDGFRLLCCKETLLLPVFIYGSIKQIFQVSSNQEPVTKIILFIFRLCLSLFLCIPVACFVICMGYYFEIARSCAAFKFDPNYVGYCKGKDALFSCDNECGNTVIHAMLTVEDSGPDTPAKLLQMLREQTINNVLPHYPLLSCTRETFMGYLHYVHKEHLDIERLINYMDDYQDNAEFRHVLNKLVSAPLPYDNKFMWEICCGKQLIETATGKWGYPVAFRIHHTCMDGVTLITFIQCHYATDGMQNIKAFHNILSTLKPFDSKLNFVENIIKHVRKLWDSGVYYHHKVNLHNEPTSPLHTENPSGCDKLIGVCLESTPGEIIAMIKFIRFKLKVTFSDIINGAVAAAITEYYVIHNLDFPPFFTILNPTLPELKNFISVHDGYSLIELGNKTTAALIRLPLKKQFLDNPEKFILAANKESKSVQDALDLKFLHWAGNAFGTLIPQSLFQRLTEGYDCTTAVSNIPAVQPPTLHGGHRVIDVFGSAAHVKKLRSSVTLLIFENRMNFTFTVDKQFLPADEHADDICKSISKYVHKIYHNLQS